ncbi:hypothetical protein [Roseobacter sp. AzwK-3b]|uniref:hypothetical protein n=1 Tax=Roseobacter sp. AzwK-3b TaxID=351016 RepID=UPI00055D4950|nr:hypothetical protein [Roseobacter sp. AzwK-3b]
MRRLVVSSWLALASVLGPVTVAAAEDVRLAVPPALMDSGLLDYVVPRFSLKTGVRIDMVGAQDSADLALTNQTAGTPVFQGPNATWSLMRLDTGNADAARFADWLTGEIGRRTITAFEIDGTAPFSLPQEVRVKAVAVTFDGDAALGKTLSDEMCGRCHVVMDEKRMNDIGSAPSFFVLRAMRDWDSRFQGFFALNPHPAFTQIKDVTPPFPIDRPSPIVPVEMDLDQLEAILAYVSNIEPADLGAPIEHQ